MMGMVLVLALARNIVLMVVGDHVVGARHLDYSMIVRCLFEGFVWI
jgi:hypothetical protein